VFKRLNAGTALSF